MEVHFGLLEKLDVGDGGGMGGAAARAFGFGKRTQRSVLNRRLLAHREEFLSGDYLREARIGSTARAADDAWANGEDGSAEATPAEDGPDGEAAGDDVAADDSRKEELWRISARVSATKEVDYALFQKDLRSRIDPILAELADRGVEGVSVDYTGLVPLVYKAQHSLLDGLVVGFITDFAIIVAVMVLLCRAASAGLVLLLPAAFPAVCVFGGMGWGHQLLTRFDLGTLLIDIGTVMAPSVALGVTVDDVVHFMLWFRKGIAEGLDRREATMLAYKGCARAMYQSWGVIGIGLSVFALSPFGPTQRFGYMMLSMLTVALVGNLVLLPALLSGPLGQLFGWSVRPGEGRAADGDRRMIKTDAGSDVLPSPHVLPGPAKQVVHA